MNPKEAQFIVEQAAGMWLNEIEQYIIPSYYVDSESRNGYQSEAREITEALDVLKAVRDAET